MKYAVPFFALFALFLVSMAGSTTAALSEATDETENFLDRPMFSTDVDLFRGQKKRRRGSGGRAWANLYYADSSLKPKGEEKIRPDLFGLQLGFDVVKAHGVYHTFFANVNQSETKYWDGSSSKIDNYLFGGGRYVYLSGCHFGFSGSIGYDRYQIAVPNVNGGTGDGLQANLFGEFGIDIILGKWGIKPFYALQYDFLYHGSIGHTPVLVNDWNGHGLDHLFGLRLNWRITDMLEIQGRTAWIHEFLDNPPPFYHARFSPVQGTSTPAVMFFGGNTGRDFAWLGCGLKLEGFYNVFVFLDYDLLTSKYHTTHLVNLGFCLGW